MSKQIFLAGGLTAEDFSYARRLVQLAETDPEIAALIAKKDPNISLPPGISTRVDGTTTYVPSLSEQALAIQAQEIADKDEIIASLTRG